MLSGYTMMGRPIDVVETSRGCTFDCSFCSIIEMRGRNFHRFPIERVIEDISDAVARGARSLFIVDDNITLDMPRFEELCAAIIRAKLNRIDYLVQAMTASIATHGERLAPLMKEAGFRYVFLGIENILDEDLAFLKAKAKNSRRRRERTTRRSPPCIYSIAMGCSWSAGSLSATRTTGRVHRRQSGVRTQVWDWPYIQHPTPYPGTPMTKDFVERGLVVNSRVEEYDGTTAVTRSAHLSSDEIEYMRWKAERWMKVRHLPAALRHDPVFVLRNGRRMLAHTFRGTTWRSALGLEGSRDVFKRYRAIRAEERKYVDWPDPSGHPALLLSR